MEHLTTTGSPFEPQPTPVRYVVAERRPHTGDDRWIFGDEWNAWCDTVEEARAVAESWRKIEPNLPWNVGVFAVVPVEGGAL